MAEYSDALPLYEAQHAKYTATVEMLVHQLGITPEAAAQQQVVAELATKMGVTYMKLTGLVEKLNGMRAQIKQLQALIG
jgi:hypothetical protein